MTRYRTNQTDQIYALTLKVQDHPEGLETPAGWLEVAHECKRLGYIRETQLLLHLTDHGRQWLESKAPSAKRTTTMQRISRAANLQLKDLKRDTGIEMQIILDEVIGVIHRDRDRLTRYARAHGGEHPWEAVPRLLKAVQAR
jgi:hypothetical protein